jgi:hypothetical protein
MPSKRKFYKTEITLTVLSEDPIRDVNLDSLEVIVDECINGEYSGDVKSVTEAVDAKRMAELLREQASEPEFFQINDDGEDLED